MKPPLLPVKRQFLRVFTGSPFWRSTSHSVSMPDAAPAKKRPLCEEAPAVSNP